MLTRTISGLLFSDDFNRPDGAVGANYVVQSGTWVISGNRLKHTIVRNAISIMRLAAGVIPARAKMHVQAQITRDDTRTFFAVTARADANNFYYYDHAASDAGGGQANSSNMNRWAGGGATNVNLGFVAGPVAVNGGTERLSLFTDVGVQKGSVNGASAITSTDATAANAINGTAGFLSFGQTSLGGNVFGYIDDLIVCSDRSITVTGLPQFYQLRVGAATATADSSGTAALDVGNVQFPIATVDILDFNGVLLETTAVNAYGGDSFAWTGVTPLARAGWTLSAFRTWASATLDAVRDANNATRWANGSVITAGSDYFMVDFGSVKTVVRASTNNTSFANDIPLTGRVDASTDGVSWTQVATWTAANIAAAILTVNFPAQVSARYIRLVALSAPSVPGNWWSIGELNLYTDTSVTSATLTATMTLPITFHGTIATGRTLRATSMALPLALTARMSAGRILRGASMPLPIGLTARMSAGRVLRAASMALPFSLLSRLINREKWLRVDLDPLTPWTNDRPFRIVNLGLGPVAGLPRNNFVRTSNVSGVYDGVTVSYDGVVVNPAGFANTVGETVQGGIGTGIAPEPPLTMRFSKPIRSFTARIQQMTFYGGFLVAFDKLGFEIARVPYDLAAWQAAGELVNGNAMLVRTIDVGANLIYSVALRPDPVDWATWSDLSFMYMGLGSQWAERDAAPATAWSN